MPPKSKSPKSKSTASASTPSPGELSLEEKVNHIFNMVNKIDVSLGEQQERLTKVETDVNLLSKEVYSLKNIVNSHEQERRSSTIRITGLPLTAEEKLSRNTADLKKRVFDRILGPILSVAYDNDLLDVQPTVENTIVTCYRVGAAAAKADTDSPPPIVVKLRSSETRICIMKSKKEATFGPTPAEKELGCKFFAIAEDLTQPAFKKLKELKNHEDVAKAWSFEGKLQFSFVGSKTIHKVSSVYDDVNTILSKAQS